MRPPKKILVAPFEYDVALEPTLASIGEASGGCDPDRTRIVVDALLSESAKKDTILHETLHALIHQTDLARRLKEFDKDLEEDLVFALTPRLFALLLENPELVEYLVGGS